MHPNVNAYGKPIDKPAHGIAADAVGLLERPQPMRVEPVVNLILRLLRAIMELAMTEVHMVGEEVHPLLAAGTLWKVYAG